MTKKPVLAQDFAKDLPQTYDDGRLNAPAFHRNEGPIRTVLNDELAGKTGHALEIGSGTGQHIVLFAKDHPNLIWWPSDIIDSHLKSIDAWQRHETSQNVKPPMRLDAAKEDWSTPDVGFAPNRDVALIISLNVIHISPWIVTEGLFKGAARNLALDGTLILYGPFSVGGKHTAPSNEKFDESLRSRNPEWGVRDLTKLEQLAKQNDLTLDKQIEMPANNFMVIFNRR